MIALSDRPDAVPGPCSGLRVVDMTALVSGPFCTQVLSDLGAEVIRIEGPTSDVMRVSAPLFRGHAAGFEQNNRGKKSVVVDVKSDAGRETVRALADTADLFVQNSRPGVMERLGLGYEALRQTNPRLIYLSINGFGETGPYAERPAYDTVIQGLTGFMPVQGAGGAPKAVLSPIADKITAIYAANAAMAALLDRERTGQGQKVVVGMLSAFAAFMLPDALTSYTFQSTDPMPSGTRTGVFEPLAVSDGFVIGLILQRRQFERLSVALGREDLLQDPRFETEAQLLDNVRDLYAELETKTRQNEHRGFPRSRRAGERAVWEGQFLARPLRGRARQGHRALCRFRGPGVRGDPSSGIPRDLRALAPRPAAPCAEAGRTHRRDPRWSGGRARDAERREDLIQRPATVRPTSAAAGWAGPSPPRSQGGGDRRWQAAVSKGASRW